MKTIFYLFRLSLGFVTPSDIEQRRMGIKLP